VHSARLIGNTAVGKVPGRGLIDLVENFVIKSEYKRIQYDSGEVEPIKQLVGKKAEGKSAKDLVYMATLIEFTESLSYDEGEMFLRLSGGVRDAFVGWTLVKLLIRKVLFPSEARKQEVRVAVHKVLQDIIRKYMVYKGIEA